MEGERLHGLEEQASARSQGLVLGGPAGLLTQSGAGAVGLVLLIRTCWCGLGPNGVRQCWGMWWVSCIQVSPGFEK